MQAGGERQLTIPPAMGYGKRKQSGIPPSSTLIFGKELPSNLELHILTASLVIDVKLAKIE